MQGRADDRVEHWETKSRNPIEAAAVMPGLAFGLDRRRPLEKAPYTEQDSKIDDSAGFFVIDSAEEGSNDVAGVSVRLILAPAPIGGPKRMKPEREQGFRVVSGGEWEGQAGGRRGGGGGGGAKDEGWQARSDTPR